MCGIVGYTGPREAGPILIEGLKRLEYRGYDSAGIALVDEAGDLFVEKRAGKLVNLQTAIADRTPHAAIGLAHTRWATHGRPNDLNAHPAPGLHRRDHGDPQRDHRELPGAAGRPRGARPHPHLRDGHRGHRPPHRGGLPRRPGRRGQGDALRRLEGAYAMVVMHRGEGNRLVGARQDVPLVVGLARRRELPGQGRGRHPGPHEPGRLPRGGRRRRRPPERRRDHRRPRRPPRAAGDHDRLVARGRREGRLRALHAQGDPRATGGAPPVDRRTGDPARPHPCRGVRRAGDDAPLGHPGRADRLRHRLLRVARRARPRSRPGPGSRRGPTSAPSSATTRRRSTSRPW